MSEDLPKVVVKWKPTYWEIYLPLSQDPMKTCEYNNSENATTLAGLMLKNKFQLQGCMYCTWQVLPTNYAEISGWGGIWIAKYA